MEKIEKGIKQRLNNFKKEDFLQQAYAFGLEYEQTRKGCSQCVVCALEKVLGLDCPDLVKSILSSMWRNYKYCGGNLWRTNRRSLDHWLFIWEE